MDTAAFPKMSSMHPLHICKAIAVLIVLGASLGFAPSLMAAEPVSENVDAINVAFPAVPVPKLTPSQTAVPVPVPVLVPVLTPVHSEPLPRPLEPSHNTLMVSRMNGEVHFKHLQSPSIDPSRALFIETGAGNSWCELKMQNCTARVWASSQISVFPETGVIYLKKGALIVQASRQSAARFSVVAGNLSSRVQGAVLRIQRDEHHTDFQVLEGNVTVFNKLSGEIYNANQVSKPVKP